MLPYQLPPLVEVPANYSGPFTDATHENGLHNKLAPVKENTMPSSEQTTPAPASRERSLHHPHDWRHLYLDLSNKVHFPAFPSFHSAEAAHVTHPHYLSRMSFPAIQWPHLIAHSSPVYATTLTSWAPPTDIRDTGSHYTIDIDVPGLQQGDEGKVLVQWMSPRTVIVSGDAKRTSTQEPVKVPATQRNSSNDFVKVNKNDANSDNEAQKAAAETTREPGSTFLISERHEGYWRRSFTLPEDADIDIDPNMGGDTVLPRWGIDAGVLSIEIPKKQKKAI
jgi:HSP20 family molecular chaperone IbpA